MNEDEFKAGFHSWLAEGRMQQVRDYASRGRSLEKTSIERLQGEWIALVRAWVTNPHEHSNPQRADIEAEFTLRGLEPPYEMVKDEFEAIIGFASNTMENLDDIEKDRINDEIADELAEFLVGEQSRRN
ncbi:hypothetical protein DC522_11625 [Microvirga sp. KLBC 81]|uniref:hypothetical protein n=1 Tax=Microvirga sp. KLBC 81 TaxID=1862707 RepID=UPI000D512586|nr:hypothetical protein [Microvirga sp. KLBC 81]PVE24311.1 hypothetical protein DC522_11625 [Microvirga sp. KLBC 81]